jgi:hypothetical protein
MVMYVCVFIIIAFSVVSFTRFAEVLLVADHIYAKKGVCVNAGVWHKQTQPGGDPPN